MTVVDASAASSPVVEPSSSSLSNNNVAQPPVVVSIADVFSFARTLKTRMCIVGAVIAASISGSIVPATAYYFAAASGELGASTDSGAFMDSIREQAYAFMILGGLILVSMTMQAALMETAAAEMTLTLKEEWFRALLRQDIAYYDAMDVTGEGTIITVNSNKYRKGLGKKLALGVQFFVTFVGSVGISLYSSWQVTLIVFAIGPVFYISALFVVKMNTSATARATETYAKAGSIVQTSVSNIRTVLSLNAVDIMIDQFKDATKEAYDGAISQFALIGLANGSIMGSMIFSFYVITLFGAFLLYDQIRDNGCDPSGAVDGNDKCDPSGLDIFTALMGMTFGATVLPQVSATVEAFVNAREACCPAFAVIRRRRCTRGPVDEQQDDQNNNASSVGTVNNAGCSEPMVGRDGHALPPYVIDSSSDAGIQPKRINGEIEFHNVSFHYPTRPETTVLNNFSLRIEAGKTVAMVGFSGSGKSTVVQLMERFYDPTAGSITLDGNDLRDLNIKWLRKSIALVQQEPKLFECTIRENIAMGNPDALEKDIEMAARMANAHDFIMSFPKAYDTEVGALGDQLSGGQRQRISIARSLVKNPKILLLDESTSALDSKSEATVQQALDKLMRTKSMTTFVIAHRLSTIKNADVIVVMDRGVVVEMGTHNELLAKQSHYFRLVEAQMPKTTAAATETGGESTLVSSEHGSCREEETKSELATPYDDLAALTKDDAMYPIMFEFDNVHFQYPSRPDAPVFRGLNLKVRQGETLALVGASGSGKSTTIQLMECFYHATSGQVKFNGTDVKELNIRWLRDQLGLVSQQPVLFDCSIEDNIRYGLPGASHEQVVVAAKQANAHNFIMSFPEGYATRVGQGSTLISGGQRQRICIARALIKKPKVLLLDEATSALDSESEKVVQDALDKIMTDPNQTCVVIAHRLSTLAGADRIAVVENGKIHEIGTHDELMALPNGRFRQYQSLQSLDDVPVEKPTSNDGEEWHENKHNDAHVKQHRKVVGDDDPSDADDEAAADDNIDKAKISANAKRARMLAKGDGFYFFVGGLGALFAGLVFPLGGLVFAYMVEVFFTQVAVCSPDGSEDDDCDDYWHFMSDNIKDKSFRVSYGYLVVIACALGGYTMLYWGLGVANERMNRRVRDAAFSSLLRQEVAWYDVRSPGTITTQLSDDAALLHAYTGEPIRTLVSALSSVMVGVVLSFFFMWPFALLVLIIVPIMGWAAELEMQMYLGSDESDLETLDARSPGGIVLEALTNIRTIASLTLEEDRINEYKHKLTHQDPHALRNSISKGASAGVGQFVQMWSMALMFWWGGWLLVNYDKGTAFGYRDFLISMFSLLFSLSGLSIAADGAVDRTKARKAADRIFGLTDRQSLIDPLSTDGKKEPDSFQQSDGGWSEVVY